MKNLKEYTFLLWVPVVVITIALITPHESNDCSSYEESKPHFDDGTVKTYIIGRGTGLIK